MSDDRLANQSSEKGDHAADALAVVSAQKQQDLRVELPEYGEESPLLAREGAYAFKAGSSLPEDRVAALNVNQVFLVRYGDELYAIRPDDLRTAFPQLARQYVSQAGTIDLQKSLVVRAALTRNAVPELIRSVGTTNIVRYDGSYYLVPHGLDGVQWGEEDVAARPGVIVVPTAREAVAIVEGVAPAVRSQSKTASSASQQPSKSCAVPLLRKTVGSHNIVEYEGWYYGIPHSLGPMDLQKVDVIEMPGVIRDVSADVVEREILELKH